jgi:hypothetical protein
MLEPRAKNQEIGTKNQKIRELPKLYVLKLNYKTELKKMTAGRQSLGS